MPPALPHARVGLRRELPAWEYKDYLGWMEQGDGRLAYGVFVQSGRIKGEVKKALRTLIERYELPVSLTGQQNIILQNVDPSWKPDIESTLGAAGLRYGPGPSRGSGVHMGLCAKWACSLLCVST